MELVELIVAVHDHLDDAGLSHAFGGALALAYVAEPRGTVDVDVNVFVPPASLDVVAAALAPLGLAAAAPGPPVAGTRFVHQIDPFPVDVFLSLHDRCREAERRRVHHPFGRGDDVLPFLSAEDLCVFKLAIGRPQDWVDLQAIAAARPGLDVEYVEEQAVALHGPTMYPLVARLRGYLRR